MTAGTRTSKTFASFSEAMLFAAYRVSTGDVYSIDKVD